MAANPVMSFTVLNYSGMLYTKSNRSTPFLDIMAENRKTNSVEFSVNQEYALDVPSQPAISESASMTAPDSKKTTRSQVTNVTQIYMRSVEISYAKMSNMGTMSGINVAGQKPNPQVERDFQVSAQMQNMMNDLEYTCINGVYNKATTDAEINKSRGILAAISTNAVSNDPDAALTKAMIKALVKSIFDNGGNVSDCVLMMNSYQKAAITALYENSFIVPSTRTVAGVTLNNLVTDFGEVGIVLSRAMPQDSILCVNPSVVHLVEQDVPGKGNWFYEPLAKTGAGEKGQLFGQAGLDYGPEWLHGKITGLATA